MTKTNTPVGPSVPKLKEQFMARSIPLEVDFADLIEIANVGREAVGLSPNQTMNTKSGLVLDSTGQQTVQLKPDAGLIVDTEGVGLVPEQQFSTGMIMMFSGSAIPAGWALCNGDNGTPDLQNRFVLGGALGDNGHSSATVSESGNQKTYTVSSNNVAPSVQVSVDGHTLSTAQIPQHFHNQGEIWDSYYNYLRDVASYGNTYKGKFAGRHVTTLNNSDYTEAISSYNLRTSSVGSGDAHSHGANASQSPHQHTVKVIPPYYTLAFIIKVKDERPASV